MGEQRLPTVGVEGGEGRPEIVGIPRQMLSPLRVALSDRFGRHAVLQSRRLGGKACALRADLQAGVGGIAVERVQDEHMQHRQERRVEVASDGVAERQRAVRGQLRDEAIGEGAQDVVLFGFRLGDCRCRPLAVDRDFGTGRGLGMAAPATATSASLSPPSEPALEAGSSSGLTKPRSISRSPSWSRLTKTPARAISAGS